MSVSNSSTQPDIIVTRSLLGLLTGGTNAAGILANDEASQKNVAKWLIEHDLGPLAAVQCRTIYPELADRLQLELFRSAAENSLHWNNLQQIDLEFAAVGMEAVLLKGAALAGTVYAGVEQRTMADVDIWLAPQDISNACSIVAGLDFYAAENSARPLALQALSGGEIQFFSHQQVPTLVELHLSPFEGWWLKRTAAVDTTGLWARKQPLAGWQSFYQLEAEDVIVHLAVHLAVGHQFGVQAVRTLVDIAITARKRAVNWEVVVARAIAWRVSTAVWLVLFLVDQLVGTPQLETVLNQLQPSAWRRRQLQRFVSPESVLSGQDIRGLQERYLFLLLLVDRPWDAGKLMVRTLWPEGEWLDARYGGSVDHWQHIRRLIAQRGV
jgi:hypothetical protein